MEESWAIAPASAGRFTPYGAAPESQPDSYHGYHESAHSFDLAITDPLEVAFDLPSNQPTELLNNWRHCPTTSEIATTNTFPTFSLDTFAQNGTATPSDQNDHQFLRQSSATVNPQLLLRSAQPAANELADVSVYESWPRFNTATAEVINGSAQDDLLRADFDLGMLDDILNSHGTAEAAETPLEKQATTLLSAPDQHQTSGSTNTDVSAIPQTYGEYEMAVHIQESHPELRRCNQCQGEFSSMYELGNHACETGHASFYCSNEGCGKAYSRFDVLQRHHDIHRPNVQRFPCQHCRRHRGANGFKRKDHLTQHLRNYHHIGVDDVSGNSRSCPHEDCSEWRPEGTQDDQHAFRKSSDYIAHMRKVHKESEFPCTVRDCDRTGPKGYFRMRDLQKHKLKEHGIPIE